MKNYFNISVAFFLFLNLNISFAYVFRPVVYQDYHEDYQTPVYNDFTQLRFHPTPTYPNSAPTFTNTAPYPNTPQAISQPRPIVSVSPRVPLQLFTNDGQQHECYRLCQEDEPPKTCYYHFNIEWYLSMSKACFDCPFNVTDCNRPDCIPASGTRRTITVINRKMPGPSIEVCQNDRIIVDVENNLLSSGTTIHWHGMHQRETPFMDGTPFVTQCPITPESTFRYDFIATQPGTHFYHSHIGMQRGDGTFGKFIVRQPRIRDRSTLLYDLDLSDHVIILNDWSNQTSESVFTDHYHSSGDNRPDALLINGQGKFHVRSVNRTGNTKPATFNIVKGFRYRFRLINAEFFSCPMELSVDGHNITLIASDGEDLRPIEATSLVSFAGERFDFVIHATKRIDNYWIKVRGLLACNDLEEARQVAVLRYEGAPDALPRGQFNWNPPQGLKLNAENQGEEQMTTIPISKMRSVVGHDDRLKPVADEKYFISYDLFRKNNTNFHRMPYTFNQVREIYRVFTPQFNHISMKLPKSPLLTSRPSSAGFCNEFTVNDTCIQGFCQCPHVISVRLNSVVEVILVDEGAEFSANHPFHLHGFTFRVLSQWRLANSTTVEEVRKLDRQGQLRRNFRNAPIKDTVAVPDGGYTVIRFKADNPGYWLFHCHIEFHADVGMGLVFKVGEHSDMKPVPRGFPTCGDYGV